MREVRRSADALVGMLPYDPKYKKSNTLLSANESPLNVPDEVLEAVIERMRTLDFNRYPDPLANALRVAIAEWHGLKAANVLVGNGGDELLYDIFAAWGGPDRALLTFPPTFSVYETNAVLTNTQVINLPTQPRMTGPLTWIAPASAWPRATSTSSSSRTRTIRRVR